MIFQKNIKTLLENDFVWKLLSSSYKIKCKRKVDVEEMEEEFEPNGEKSKKDHLIVLIQIFSVKKIIYDDLFFISLFLFIEIL